MDLPFKLRPLYIRRTHNNLPLNGSFLCIIDYKCHWAHFRLLILYIPVRGFFEFHYCVFSLITVTMFRKLYCYHTLGLFIIVVFTMYTSLHNYVTLAYSQHNAHAHHCTVYPTVHKFYRKNCIQQFLSAELRMSLKGRREAPLWRRTILRT